MPISRFAIYSQAFFQFVLGNVIMTQHIIIDDTYQIQTISLCSSQICRLAHGITCFGSAQSLLYLSQSIMRPSLIVKRFC